MGRDRFPAEVLVSFEKLQHDRIANHGGKVIGDTGDGVLAEFVDPRAALDAAIDIQRGTGRISAGATELEPTPLQARVGLHRSEVHLKWDASSRKYLDGYPDIAFARRILDACCKGQILASETVFTEAKDKCREQAWRPWPNRGLKSFQESAQTLYELLWDTGTSKCEPGSQWLPAGHIRYLNSYIDRPELMRRVRDWLADGTYAVLALWGFGGVGKTRLATETVLQLGSHFTGGIVFVRLDEAVPSIPRDQVSARDLEVCVLSLLELQSADYPDTAALVCMFQQRATERGPILLVLDNWESVQNGETLDWIVDLVKYVPQLKLLLTTRERLDLADFGDTYEIPFLRFPSSESEPFEDYESCRLFADRIRQRVDGWLITPATRPHLFRLLKALQGHALGIEIVAANSARYPGLAEPAERIERSLLGLQNSNPKDRRSGAPRHTSLQASLDWSVGLLGGLRDELFRLSVFPADFSEEAARIVASVDEQSLEAFVDASLVQVTVMLGRNRYEQLPVVREYCVENLRAEERSRFEERFDAWCLDTAKQSNTKGLGHYLRFAREVRNLNAAAQRLLRLPLTEPNARSLVLIGFALRATSQGDRDANLRHAIACYGAASRFYTKQTHLQQWAAIQIYLGAAYSDLPTGGREANLHRAITCYQDALTAVTKSADPHQWATTQNALGLAYAELPSGDRDSNLRRGIGCYDAALMVFTELIYPQDWAGTKSNLGIAYSNLTRGDRVANLRHGIECYESALKVYREQDFPRDWAQVQNNLGIAYRYILAIDTSLDPRSAVDCHDAALRVYTEQTFPWDWAMTQNNLGVALVEIRTGNLDANLRRAIDCCKGALRVYHEHRFAQHWATAQENLGVAYSRLTSGDQSTNLRLAIECFHSALRVRTEDDLPRQWAMTQRNLGTAYAALPTGDRVASLFQATEYFKAALRVYTEQAFPQEWAKTQNNLGVALLDLGDRHAALEAFQLAARGYRSCNDLHSADHLEAWLGDISS